MGFMQGRSDVDSKESWKGEYCNNADDEVLTSTNTLPCIIPLPYAQRDLSTARHVRLNPNCYDRQCHILELKYPPYEHVALPVSGGYEA